MVSIIHIITNRRIKIEHIRDSSFVQLHIVPRVFPDGKMRKADVLDDKGLKHQAGHV